MLVVALIGVLAALLLPAAVKAKDAARKAACREAERQIQIANAAESIQIIFLLPADSHCFDCHPSYP
jgi:type II secretory pathway pseudopilin PulG